MVDKSINQRQPVCCKNRNEMLERFLTDDSLNDVVLKGTDGVEVPANRFLLAARSDVFKGMLLGKFQESSLPVVDLSFSGSVLKAVVEFVLTDSAQILKFNKRKAPDGEENDVPTHQIESLVSLAVAASYFNLGGLGVLVLECFEKSLLAKQPCASFAILHACRMAGNAVPEALQLKAKDWVRTTGTWSESLSANHVASLNATVVEEILMDLEMDFPEWELFRILKLWRDIDPNQRKKSAAGMSKHISFEKIEPQYLTTVVAPSGLATSEQLSEAYKNQALTHTKLSAYKNFQNPRNLQGHWVSTGRTDEHRGCPIAIKVEGAGTEAVNGVYLLDELNENKPKYIMQSSYEGKQLSFRIIYSFDTWFIDSEIPSVQDPDFMVEVDFYKATSTLDFPPPGGWVSCERGNGSSPHVSYKF